MYSAYMDEALIILFGSRAKGTARESSDFDVAVLKDHPIDYFGSEFGDMLRFMSEKFHMPYDRIDLVDLFDASPLLWHEAATHGKLLQGIEGQFVGFKIRAWKRFMGAQKLYRMRFTHLAEKMKTFT